MNIPMAIITMTIGTIAAIGIVATITIIDATHAGPAIGQDTGQSALERRFLIGLSAPEFIQRG